LLKKALRRLFLRPWMDGIVILSLRNANYLAFRRHHAGASGASGAGRRKCLEHFSAIVAL